MTKPRLFAFILAVFWAIAFLGYRLHGRNWASAQAPVNAPARPQANDLRNVMQADVHTEYTHMSFTIWHDQPLTNDKLDTIAASSARIADVARRLDSYTAAYRQQGWNAQDVQFFEQKRLQLLRVAEELHDAAQKHDSPQVVSFFLHLDNTCQSCHKRFRPDLSWI